MQNQMSKWGAASYVIGTMVGSGIFITPTTIFANVHSVGISLLIWLLSALLSLLGAYCYIELGTGIQRSGADFTYLCHVNWQSLAFASMLCSVLLINPATMAIKMDALGQYLFQALHLDLCDENVNFWAPKLIGFSIASKFDGCWRDNMWTNIHTFSFAHKTMGPFAFVMPLLISLVFVGSINASFFGSSRYLWAAAREGHVPAFINCLNTKYDSPRAALCIQFFLSILLSFMGNLDELISYVSYAHLVTRILTISVLLRIRLVKDQQSCKSEMHHEVIVSPILVPILYLALCLFMALFTLYSSFQIAFSSLLSLAIGLCLYALFLSPYGLQRSIVFRNRAHTINDKLCRICQILFDGKVELEE